jgi:hypothetical protein
MANRIQPRSLSVALSVLSRDLAYGDGSDFDFDCRLSVLFLISSRLASRCLSLSAISSRVLVHGIACIFRFGY